MQEKCLLKMFPNIRWNSGVLKNTWYKKN